MFELIVLFSSATKKMIEFYIVSVFLTLHSQKGQFPVAGDSAQFDVCRRPFRSVAEVVEGFSFFFFVHSLFKGQVDC